MTSNPILNEIRQTRDQLAQEAGYDTKRLFEYARKCEREASAKGVKFVSFARTEASIESGVLREEPPKP